MVSDGPGTAGQCRTPGKHLPAQQPAGVLCPPHSCGSLRAGTTVLFTGGGRVGAHGGARLLSMWHMAVGSSGGRRELGWRRELGRQAGAWAAGRSLGGRRELGWQAGARAAGRKADWRARR